MTAPRGFLSSTIGLKIVMAVTGVILVGFILGHMVGNMLLYRGPEAINAYGRELRELLHGSAIWIARGTLLAAVLLHIWSAWALTLKNRQARPVAYKEWKAQDSTYASRTMRVSGLIILFFVIYHLMHLTIGNAHPNFVEGDVYHNVVAGFQVWWVAAFYIAAQLALGLHLYHGLWSMFQSLGLNHPRYNRWRNIFAQVFALVVTLGNISFPVAVLTGWVS